MIESRLILSTALVASTGVVWGPGSARSMDAVQDDRASFACRHSPAELKELRAGDLLERAREDWKQLEATNAAGPYEATWDSLERHPVPEWYADAKLGIFYDWGLYSVAGYDEKEWKKARYPDWYLHRMYTSLKDYHARTWGPGFERDDFIPLFTGEAFDAKEIVDLIVESGARYLVPFSKHHDGFCLWDSSYSHDEPLEWVDTGKDAYGMVVRIPGEMRRTPEKRPGNHALGHPLRVGPGRRVLARG